MPEYDPHYVRSIYETPANKEVDAPVRLGQHPVFEKVLEAQFSLLDTRVKEKALHEYWVDHKELASELTREVESAKLINKTVFIEGGDVTLPHVTHAPSRESIYINPLSGDKLAMKLFESSLSLSAYAGPFAGFTLKFKPSSDGRWGLYEPFIAYRVYAGKYVTPDSTTSIYATGDVRTTSIDFKSDRDIDNQRAVLDQLRLLIPYAKESISVLEGLLREGAPTHYSMHDIASVARFIVEAVDDEGLRKVIEDNIADLVKWYLGDTARYSIKTPQLFRVDATSGDGSRRLMITKAQPFVFSKKIQDVAFIEEYPGVPPRDSLGRNGRSLHIVVSGGENDESSLCVPFSKMYEFVKK